eukprot:scaffold11454_cov168-Amphora_coffeaeformis.AAC.7
MIQCLVGTVVAPTEGAPKGEEFGILVVRVLGATSVTISEEEATKGEGTGATFVVRGTLVVGSELAAAAWGVALVVVESKPKRKGLSAAAVEFRTVSAVVGLPKIPDAAVSGTALVAVESKPKRNGLGAADGDQ